MKPAEMQPKPGEAVVHCPHMGKTKDQTWHWFHLGHQPIGLENKETGERQLAFWFTVCSECYIAAKKHPDRPIPVGGHFIEGEGNKPIYAPETPS